MYTTKNDCTKQVTVRQLVDGEGGDTAAWKDASLLHDVVAALEDFTKRWETPPESYTPEEANMMQCCASPLRAIIRRVKEAHD